MIRTVLFIPTLTAGGAERVASILANEWCHYPGTLITVVTLFEDKIFYPLDPRIEHLCLGLVPNRIGLARAFDLSGAIWKLRRAIIRRRPTFVLSFMNKYNVFCLVACLGTRQRVIAAERDSPTEALPPLRTLLRRVTYPLAAAVFVQSTAARDFFAGTIRATRLAVLPNPVSQLIRISERQPQKIVLNVSRLHPKKGHADLLRAFAATNDEDWVLVICGDGPLRHELEQYARELGVARRTQFLGTVTDLRPYLAAAGVFAFSSYWEGFPNALAEAMLAGVACVAYDCPTGPADLIEDGTNGILVPVGDVAGLTAAMSRLMANPALAEELGRRASTIASQVTVASVSCRYWDACVRAADGQTLQAV